MNITLLRVPTLIDDTAITAPITPPIGIAYLKSIVNHFTDNIQIIDAVGNYPVIHQVQLDNKKFRILGETKEEIVDSISPDIDILLVSIMFSQDWLYVKDLLQDIRSKCHKTLIVAGGEHITAIPEYCMESSEEIDICVLGEGESILFDLLENYNTKNINDTPGIVYRDGKQIIRSKAQKRIRGISTIEWPDWEGIPLQNYFDGQHSFGVNHGKKTMPILGTRGCPYQCTFCSSPLMWTTLWMAREPKDVMKEMKHYIQKYDVYNFDFYDLTAVVKKKWIIEFCKLLISEKLNITWQLPSGTRSEAIDDEVAELLYNSGCKNLSYAPESGSLKTLKIIKKKINLDKMIASMKSSVNAGINIKANIMCGFPHENYSYLYDTWKFIIRMAYAGCHDVSITQFSPYPGSELFDQLLKEGKITYDNDYFKALSSYSSISSAKSYCDHISNNGILFYKYFGTLSFYFTNFLFHPGRFISLIINVYEGVETSRLEKTIFSLLHRLRPSTK